MWFPASPGEISELPAHELPSINPRPRHSFSFFFLFSFFIKAASSLQHSTVPPLLRLAVSMTFLNKIRKSSPPASIEAGGYENPSWVGVLLRRWFEPAASVVE